MPWIRQLRRAALVVSLTLFAGYVLAGCQEEKPKPTAGGYYSGPLTGKGGPSKSETSTGGGKANVE